MAALQAPLTLRASPLHHVHVNGLDDRYEKISEDSNVVLVKLKSMERLYAHWVDWNNMADPYLKICLRYNNINYQEQTSSFRPQTKDPIWVPEEKFIFELPDGVELKDIRLFLMVYDHDNKTSDDYLGYNSISLTDEYILDGVHAKQMQVVVLDPKKNQETSGRINFELCVGKKDDVFDAREEYIFQNQRWYPISGWQACDPSRGTYSRNDPSHFSRLDGGFSHATFSEVEATYPTRELEDIVDTWHIISTSGTDPEGFQYGRFSFKSKSWYPVKVKFANIRRKIWIRRYRV